MAAVRVPDAPSLLLTIRRWWPAVLAAAAWIAWLLSRPPRPSAWLVTLTGLGVLGVVSIVAARRAGTPWRAYRRPPPRVVRARRRAGLRARRADGRRAGHHHRRRDLFLAAPQPGLRSRPRRRARVRRPRAAAAAEPLRADRPGAHLAAALSRRRRWSTRSAARSAWPRPPPAIRWRSGSRLPYVRAALLSSFAAGAVGLACVLAILRRWFGRGDRVGRPRCWSSPRRRWSGTWSTRRR